MNVDLMRKIDHHLGIPLTFISTLLLKLIWKLTGQKPTPVKKILFIELSEMGSTILADPAMRHAQTKFNAELYFVIFRKNKPSLDLINTIPQQNIFCLRENNLITLIYDAFRYLLWCRKHKIDTTIDLELFSRVSALLTGFSGANKRIGFHNFHGEGLYRGDLLTHKVLYNPHLHIAQNFMALIHPLETEKNEHPFAKIQIPLSQIQIKQITYTDTQKAKIHHLIQNTYPEYHPQHHQLILINPNASDLLPQRRWPKDHFIQLMQRIAEHFPQTLILITGAPNEKEEAEALRKAVKHERCLNFAGQLKLLEMPILYSIAKLMVTNDSGPGHFSAITPLKTFVLFGPETPKLYGSLGNSTPIYAGLACSPCVSAANHRKTPCTDPVCMQAISVDQVFQAIKTELTPLKT